MRGPGTGRQRSQAGGIVATAAYTVAWAAVWGSFDLFWPSVAQVAVLALVGVATVGGVAIAYALGSTRAQTALIAAPFGLLLLTPLNPIVRAADQSVTVRLAFLVAPAFAMLVGLLVGLPLAGVVHHLRRRRPPTTWT